MRRRNVEAKFDSGNAFTLRTAKPLSKATLLFLKSGQEPRSISINGQPVQSNRSSFLGFEFDAVTVDVAGQLKVQIA